MELSLIDFILKIKFFGWRKQAAGMKLNKYLAFIDNDHFEIVHHYRQQVRSKRRKMLRNQNYRRRKEIQARDALIEGDWNDEDV